VTRAEILAFLRQHQLAVEASVAPAGAAQAALVGIVISDAFEVFFDTVRASRKFHNLSVNPKLAFVIGWDHEQTVQYEGVADVPEGDELERLKQLYYARFPDGPARLAWPGLVYVRVKPSWLRYSDFRGAEPRVVEIDFTARARP
jgi:Pyridoxamine 5'-phosphate oxidase